MLCSMLFILQTKESSFCPAGHAVAYSKGKNEDNFACKMNPKGAASFCISTLKKLDRSYGYGHMLFLRTSTKNLHAQNGHNI